MLAAVFLRTDLCFASRALIDQAIYAIQAAETDQKLDNEPSDDSDGAAMPDPFAAEREMVMKGASQKSDSESAQEKLAGDPIAKTQSSGKSADKKDGIETPAKISSSGNSKKQPGMYYYQ